MRYEDFTPDEAVTIVNSWDEVPHFATEEEAANWWDTHSLAEHLWSKRHGPPPGSLAERLVWEQQKVER